MGELVNVDGEGGGFTPALGPCFLAFFPEGILKGREGGVEGKFGEGAGEERGQGKVLGKWLTACPKGPRLAPKEHLCVHTFLAPTPHRVSHTHTHKRKGRRGCALLNSHW